MIVKPKRIQRKRTKGWKMPDNTVYVGRPTKWGNPYFAHDTNGAGKPIGPSGAVMMYQNFLQLDAEYLYEDMKELKGKNLACFCPLDQPCHADILLELANR